ncbi:hypothetical protein RND81_13G195500 [Saponaria officinalis]|uniref:Uncharacterized protein n=1 Tax=Saponaria officinalis TaxID=3572 RepID=A0AAW1GZQ8_SAPOF
MVAVFNKDLLSWYLVTQKLQQCQIEGSADNAEEQPPETSQQPQEQEQEQEKEQEQEQLESEFLQVVVDSEIQEQVEVSELENPREFEWIVSIKERLEEAIYEGEVGSWAKMCIYRVPHFLRDQGNDKAYVPQVVSIGPYHRGTQRLLAMDRHKWRALNHMLNRTQQDIMVYFNAMKELEERTRGCYEGLLNLNGNEFVEMMVLDGCFVIELLTGYVEGFENLGYQKNDPIFATRGMLYSIRRDMMMIENQIPLFVLDKLLALQLGNSGKKGLIAELALIFFDPLSPIDEPSMHVNEVQSHPLSDQSGLHCLDLFRRSLLQNDHEPVPRRSRWNVAVHERRTRLIPCVTDLEESGIKFKKRESDKFWDIEFKDGFLHIPRLVVHDGTKALFLNLVAYEQSHLDCTKDITAYVVFMHNLINNAQDVRYLHHCGILEHWLGNDVEVADMFNHLCREVVLNINDSHLSKVSEKINAYNRSKWNAWKAILKHKYFHNPWAIISILAAVFLILLFSAQTYYSVYSYYKPPH